MMHRPLVLARTCVVLLLTWGSTSTAMEWQGAEPGITPTQELLQRFGRPGRQLKKDGQLILDYRGKPRDTRSVRFYVDLEQDRLQRIEVTPKTPPTRDTLEESFGPPCTPDSRDAEPCYEVRATPDNQLAYAYPSLGVEVVFKLGRVSTLTYHAPRRPPPAMDNPGPPSAPAAPSRTSAPAQDELSLSLKPSTVVTASTASPSLPSAGSETSPSLTPTASPTPSPGRVPITDVGSAPSSDERGLFGHDVLTLGGIYYQRAQMATTLHSLGNPAFTPNLPSLVDLYTDVKPSESLRAFVRGRLLYDPLDAAFAQPEIILDQIWFRFVLAEHVFITAGRQHLKWGSSRIWNPTDFLRSPNPTPLDAFDLRTGVDMIKVNIPWEAMGANLWLVTTADLNGPADKPLRYGGAVRAEATLGTSELAATAAFQQGRRPRYGLDWSVGVGLFDFNAEAALVHDSAIPLWENSASGYVPRTVDGPQLLTSVGAQGTFRFAQVFRATVRLEGFYNQLGSDDRSLITWLVSKDNYQPLYSGRYYLMGQLTLERRSVVAPTLFFTVLTNLSDTSVLPRLDLALLPMRDVYLTAFVEAPLGTRGGEFRFEPDPSVAALPSTGLPLVRTGLSVRIRM